MSEKNQGSEEPKKKSFFKNLFFVEQEAVEKAENVKVEPKVVQQPQPILGNSQNVVGVINQDIYNNLKSILSQRNLPGPDYLEIKTAADAMKSYLPDENQRFLVSFASIKATSPKLTKKVVTDSIDEYVKYIENEREVFQEELKTAFNEEVNSRQLKIDEFNLNIEKARAEIQRLSDTIVTYSNDINILNGEKLSKQTEIEIKNKNFQVTIDTIVSELKSDKQKIETLINE